MKQGDDASAEPRLPTANAQGPEAAPVMATSAALAALEAAWSDYAFAHRGQKLDWELVRYAFEDGFEAAQRTIQWTREEAEKRLRAQALIFSDEWVDCHYEDVLSALFPQTEDSPRIPGVLTRRNQVCDHNDYAKLCPVCRPR